MVLFVTNMVISALYNDYLLFLFGYWSIYPNMVTFKFSTTVDSVVKDKPNLDVKLQICFIPDLICIGKNSNDLVPSFGL